MAAIVKTSVEINSTGAYHQGAGGCDIAPSVLAVFSPGIDRQVQESEWRMLKRSIVDGTLEIGRLHHDHQTGTIALSTLTASLNIRLWFDGIGEAGLAAAEFHQAYHQQLLARLMLNSPTNVRG